MSEPHAAIETTSLRKAFGEKVAVEDLSLQVERGEVFGFLGPNGAGKTTSVKMLLGLCAPTSGQGFLLGQPIGTPSALRKVGFLPEHFRFHDWLKAHEFLFVHGRLYGMKESVLKPRVAELLELVGLAAHSQKKLAEFSKGMLQRIGLAQALLNDPEIVFLDEPTSGLDPMGRRLVRDIIRDVKSRGTTVFLNSHLLSEVEVTTADTGGYLYLSGMALDRVSPAPANAKFTLYLGSYGTDKVKPAGVFRWNGNNAWELVAPAPNGQSITSLLATNDPAAPALLAATDQGIYRWALK
jgi:ABC-type multidrug transport system ATPase subunit